ncbi:methyltransferase domain-containing protein [Streptomyces rectiverticillatus]|uniref:methyltransferase domain-containing protein n=1 Tax=Streptomyces rectiverticillatus TaxID=173860 RepID=UPI0015C37DCB|nr:methyltransferase domain-containing protein [Streptomyces rectiverticillatus]QLE74380.1 methyltransferase domain-containing protein [Streptomyces rectiverticillatus]
MTGVRDYRLSLERSRQALVREDRPAAFTMCGREWDLLPEVFAPIYSPATGIALDFLGLAETSAETESRRFSGAPGALRGSLLEIGSGTGVVAVAAALAGCARVVAADINPAAVLNTSMNAARHGVSGRVRAFRSDLFDQLDPGERFDTVFWSSNYVLAPVEYQPRTMHERAYIDPGYAAHSRFLEEAPGLLAPGGTVLLHFSSRGDVPALRRIADRCGRRLDVVRRTVVREGEHEVEHMLLEVTPAADSARCPEVVR